MVNTNTNNNNKISTAPKSGIKTCNQRRSNGKLFQTSGAVTERRLPNTVLQNGTERKWEDVSTGRSLSCVWTFEHCISSIYNSSLH